MSSSQDTVRLVRVFVSSPGDVQDERDVLEEVVSSINRVDGQRDGFRLDLFRWEADVVPQIGPEPQEVVDGQTPAYQIYLGIMSARFGGGGATKEFRDALQSWQGTKSPWVMFYFNDAPKISHNLEKAKEWPKVCEFRQELESQGIVGKYTGARGSRHGFYEQVSDHLRMTVDRLLQPNASPDAQRSSTNPTVPAEYTEWLLSRCGDVELMGLELKHGSGVRLNHVYTPLATSAQREDVEQRKRSQSEGLIAEQREAKQLLLGLLNEQSLYVSGDPGSGKSTFCRWVTWLTCNGTMPAVDVPAPEGYQETFPDHLYGRIPVLVRLRDFWQFLPPSGVQSLGLGGLETALRQWLADQEYPGLDWACLKSHLDGGSALLMLDGVDEVPPVRSSDSGQWYPRDMLIAGLAEAVARWAKDGNCVLVTSRPYGLDGEQQRKLGLINAPILSLDDDLQTLLVRRWFIRLKEARDLGLETADAMMNHIRVERGLNELAINPLLLTAMCIIYDEGKRLPHDKYLLYDRIVDTVLHKRYMGKESIETIRGRLAAVALDMHTGQGLDQQRAAPEATASEREIDLALQAYRKVDGSTDPGLTDTVRVREDLLSQSGLLVSRGDDGAAFYHLSIQEFLAAERLFILHGQKRAELVELFLARGKTAGWRNTLGLLFGDLVDTFKPHSGVECLRELSCRIELPPLEPAQRDRSDGVWNQAIVFGDCLQILQGRESAIPDDLTEFFQQCVFRAIEQEIAVKDRQTLGVILGRLGDPRVKPDLRLAVDADNHPGYVKVQPDTYYVGDEKKPLVIDEPFWLSKYPVTNSQYALFVEGGGYARREFWSDQGWQWIQAEKFTAPDYRRNQRFNAPNQPVVTVSWWEAEAFCRWAGGSLPTEQQWEAAARGPEGFKFPWGDDWEDGICNSDEVGLGGTSAVGIFPRSTSAAFGLVDMAGNVWEWCADESAALRVFRGGSWALFAEFCRSASLSWSGPELRSNDLGFRVAAVPLSQQAKNKSK